VKSSKGNVTPS